MQHEAIFTLQVPMRKDGTEEEQYLCAFNQRAMRVVQQVTGKDPVMYLIDDVGGLERTQLLAYACTETFRRGNGYVVSFDEWIDGPYLGVYGSPYWADLAAFVEDLVVQTFPWVAELRGIIQDAATKSKPQESSSTGTVDTTSPSSYKLSKTKRNSGIGGTSQT